MITNLNNAQQQTSNTPKIPLPTPINSYPSSTIIIKLLIQGVRSFSPRTSQTIEFDSPLTLIQGANGAGKTSIIEALRYVTTGKFPPDGDRGKSWVNDPRISNTPENLANVRILFRNFGGKKYLVSRAVKVSQTQKGLSFKSLESFIKYKSLEDNQTQTVSNKCSDLDVAIPKYMGVTPAVLAHLIFCHQSQSNWPLEDSKIIETYFNELFNVTAYTKAVEQIVKVRREFKQKLQVEQKNLKGLSQLISLALEHRRTIKSTKEITDKQAKEISSSQHKLAHLNQQLSEYLTENTRRGKLNTAISIKQNQKRNVIQTLSNANLLDSNNQLSTAALSLLQQEDSDSDPDSENGENNSKLTMLQESLNTIKNEILTFKTKQMEINQSLTQKSKSISDLTQKQNNVHTSISLSTQQINSSVTLLLNQLSKLSNSLQFSIPTPYITTLTSQNSQNGNLNHRKEINIISKSDISNCQKELQLETQKLAATIQLKKSNHSKELTIIAQKIASTNDSLDTIDGLIEEKTKTEKEISTLELSKRSASTQSVQIQTAISTAFKSQKSKLIQLFRNLNGNRGAPDLIPEIENLVIEPPFTNSLTQLENLTVHLTSFTTLFEQEIMSKIQEKESKLQTLTPMYEKSLNLVTLQPKIKQYNKLKSENSPILTYLTSPTSGLRKIQKESSKLQNELAILNSSKTKFEKLIQVTAARTNLYTSQKEEMENAFLELFESIEDFKSDASFNSLIDTNNVKLLAVEPEFCNFTSEYLHTTGKTLSSLLESIDSTLTNFRSVVSSIELFSTLRTSLQNYATQHSCCPLCTSSLESTGSSTDHDIMSIFESKLNHYLPTTTQSQNGQTLPEKISTLSKDKSTITKMIYQLESSKTKLSEYHSMQTEIDESQTKFTQYQSSLKDITQQIDEISTKISTLSSTQSLLNEYVEIKRLLDSHSINSLEQIDPPEVLNDQIKAIRSSLDILNDSRHKIYNISIALNSTQNLSAQIKSFFDLNEKVSFYNTELAKKQQHLEKTISNLKTPVIHSSNSGNSTGHSTGTGDPIVSSITTSSDNDSIDPSKIRKSLEKALFQLKSTQKQLNMVEIPEEHLLISCQNMLTQLGAFDISNLISEITHNLSKLDEYQIMIEKLNNLSSVDTAEYEKNEILLSNLEQKETENRDKISRNGTKLHLISAIHSFQSIDGDIKIIQTELSQLKYSSLQGEKIRAEINELSKKIASTESLRSHQLSELRELSNKLKRNPFLDIDTSYIHSRAHVVGYEKAIKDSMAYEKGLSEALYSYQTEKMKEINRLIKELWQITYAGSDIETIRIDSVISPTTLKSSYKVKMILKEGQVALNTKGRCSAGQRMLSSLVIRLALSEAFCNNCGILALDEPTTNLDVANIKKLVFSLKSLIRARRNRLQLIIITHDSRFIEMFGTSNLAENYIYVTKDPNGYSRIEKRKMTSLGI